MRTYYRSGDVLITDEVFAVREPVPMRFRLERLWGVHIVADDVRAGRLGAVCGVVVTLTLTVLAVSRLHSLLDGLTASVVGVVLAGVIAGRAWGRSRALELRARYGGDEVLLYRAADPLVFGQVRRGLIRALEELAAAPSRQADH